MVNFVLRARANNSGRNPNWTSYENCARLSRRKCSPIPKSCCRLFRLTPKRQPTSRRNTTTLSTV
ncbi:hypothetical protein DMI62_22370 [Escherichia coli]|nr:hypothetical protein [Escherichia coli]